MDEVLDRLIRVLESARKRKNMYFDPVSPVAAIHWLNGLRTGVSFYGLDWSFVHRQRAVERLGLEYCAAAWEDGQLVRRGLTSEAVVDQLLAIEIEMWQSQRSRIAE